ncbi:MAG: dTDP-4-dehydrorhamnose reductase [Lachnospira sp.]|nr:dTDP-4-dehydrorhamnose reductase [Lachnospira sp.]
MKTIWIVGASGHVGSALIKHLDCMQYELIETDKEDVDITNEEQVTRYMNINRPDVVINCAGYTDPQACKDNVDEAYKVNAVGVRNLAQAAQSIEAKLIQVSTDDVFDLAADRPYNEFDDMNPTSVYGKSKAAGERFVTQLMTRYVIVRSSWVYGIGKDFVDDVLNAANDPAVKTLDVNINRRAVPTSAKELVNVIDEFIDDDHYGIYHAVCSGGSCNQYEYAVEILKKAGKEGQLELIPVTESEDNRPEYSVLDNMMLRITGLEEPLDWKEALAEYINETGGIE